MRWISACIFLFVFQLTSLAQTKVEYSAQRMNEASKVTVDGKLDEAIWQSISFDGDFIVRQPNPGAVPAQQSKIAVVYDDNSLYIAAKLFDEAPDSILTQLSQRDAFDNVDWCGFIISPYQDGVNGVGFIVTAAGVQFDTKYSALGEDVNWNAVWESAVEINEKGWFVEMQIPYSAIRFPEVQEQQWDINFIRSVRRTREESTWSKVDPQIDGFLNQCGTLKGVKNITPPVRLFLFPYVSAYAQNFGGEWADNYNGGMDLKYGINDAFTLDMTLVPDFGQVQSDNLVLNLSPYEVRYNENRQFFTEGTELFNKGGLFYSRRIGGFPFAYGNASSSLQEGEEVAELPTQGKLVNASKLSGRTKQGLGVGVFNAITRNTFATIKNGDDTRLELVDPSTNYNILVLDQNLKNNSFVTLINTNVTRAGSFKDANVTGTQFRIRDKKNRLQFSGDGAYSHESFGTSQADEKGHAYSLSADKIGGNYRFGVGYDLMNDTYDINDLGYLFRNNTTRTFAYFNYNQFKPTKRFNRWWMGVNTNYNRLYMPNEFTGFNLNANIGGTTKGFHTIGGNAGVNPVKGADYFDPRLPGKHYNTPENANASVFISSDYRRRFALDLNTSYRKHNQTDRKNVYYRISPRFRFNDKSSVVYVFAHDLRYQEEGFTTFDSTATHSIYGRRDVNVVTNVIDYNYIFTNRMGLTMRLRHYWSRVNYNSFHILEESGNLATESYSGLNSSGSNVVVNSDGSSSRDQNYNAFSIDLVYSWVFAPGSELRVVWKNNIEQLGNQIKNNPWENFSTTIEQDQLNSFSLKLLYFIDYSTFRNKRKEQ